MLLSLQARLSLSKVKTISRNGSRLRELNVPLPHAAVPNCSWKISLGNLQAEMMDVSLGSLEDDVFKDEANIIRPRNYVWYDCGSAPDWIKGLLPPAEDNGSSYPDISAKCVKMKSG